MCSIWATDDFKEGSGGHGPKPCTFSSQKNKNPPLKNKNQKLKTFFDFKQEKKQEGKESMHPISN